MKIAYVFATPNASAYKLTQMILPQLEADTHGVEVVGMFFFDDNTLVLRRDDPVGERLAKVAQDKGILLMMCDMCALQRNLAEGKPRWCNTDGTGRTEPNTIDTVNVVEGVHVGCFPDLYSALGGNPPDHIITL
jgi:hypothetical protein